MRESDLKEKYRTLVERLHDRTIDDKLEWNTDWGGDVSATFGNYIVALKLEHSSDGEPLELVELRDQSNTLIDSFSDVFLSEKAPSKFGISTYYELMGALRAAARRKASGVDKALDSILTELDTSAKPKSRGGFADDLDEDTPF